MIQKDYNRYQQAGQVGSIARPSAPYDIDQGIAGVELRPGEGVYYDPSSNAWIKPVSTATRKLVTHIVIFDLSDTNLDIAVPTTNNLTEVVFAIDAVIKLAAFGSFFVLAGETIETEDAVVFNESTGKWIKYEPASATPNDLRKKAFTAYLNPGKTVADGGIFEAKISTPNYSFPAIADIDSVTLATTIAAADIKTLRATPVEIAPAPGAGFLLQLVSLMLVLTAGTEVLSETAANLQVEYDDGSGAAVTGAIEMTGFIDQAADTITNAIPDADSIEALADAENKNLALFNAGAGEFAGNASDDAVLTVYTTYRTLTLP